MKKFICTAAFFLFTSYSFSQYFLIYEFESENQSDTMEMFDLMMSATKEVVEKDLNMVTFQKELSNTHFLVRTYGSLQEWVDEDKVSEEINPQVFQKLSGVENIQEKFLAMQKATDSKGARLFELLPEYSNMAPYLAMSNEEKKEYKYRRVVLYDLTDAGEQAFLANQKFWIDSDKELGVDYLYALMKPVFATDADYMLVLLDKSRFDYHKNWSDRMDKRFSDEDFNANYEKIEKDPVSSVVEEWNLNLLEEYIY
tara:strand:+ start:4331 stop:5095 length:765 start_codon:yes stop_codon:yes gene_type:complete